MKEAVEILKQSIKQISNSLVLLCKDYAQEFVILKYAHTIPTILGRVYNSCRMGSEANQINPVLFAVNSLQTSAVTDKSHSTSNNIGRRQQQDDISEKEYISYDNTKCGRRRRAFCQVPMRNHLFDRKEFL